MNSGRIWRQYLQMLRTSGVTHLPEVRLPETPSRRQPAQRASPTQTTAPRVRSGLRSPDELKSDTVSPVTMHETTQQILNSSFHSAEEKADALCRLAEAVADCRRCKELADTRTQTVFGVGNADARIMFIGEAPGADEDRQGEPFVGRAGQLLNRIIAAAGMQREDLYICNILRCRPPGNRNPLPQEAANCREFLDAQIQIVRPEYIVCWGTVAARNLLSETRTIGRLRGVFHDYQGIRVLCTYHPSYLLRNPSAKKDVWDDIRILLRELDMPVP